MRLKDNGDSITLWASKWDTEEWATKPGAAWPCSTLRGRRFVASFDSNGLYDLTVNGRMPSESDDIDGNELSAICADFIDERIPQDHPVWFVTVGQFRERR